MKRAYFEFNEHDYYALIAVEEKPDDSKNDLVKKATEIYVRDVTGDSISEAFEQGTPDKIEQEKAFWSFANSYGNDDAPLKDMINDFHREGTLLVDGALI